MTNIPKIRTGSVYVDPQGNDVTVTAGQNSVVVYRTHMGRMRWLHKQTFIDNFKPKN